MAPLQRQTELQNVDMKSVLCQKRLRLQRWKLGVVMLEQHRVNATQILTTTGVPVLLYLDTLGRNAFIAG